MVKILRRQQYASPCDHRSEPDIVVAVHVGVHANACLRMRIGSRSKSGKYTEVEVGVGGSPDMRRAATYGRNYTRS